MTERLRFTVYGTAMPAGSKRAVPIGGKKGATRWTVKDDNPKSRPWKLQVAQRAGEAMLGRALFDGPMLLVLRFYRARPKGHFGTSGDLNAKGRRTPLPAVKPDTTKLVRGVEDALTGVVWRDDAQVCGQVALKEYGEPERVVIEVRPIASAADVVESEAYQMAMGL